LLILARFGIPSPLISVSLRGDSKLTRTGRTVHAETAVLSLVFTVFDG
jgi:hypothetical protein